MVRPDMSEMASAAEPPGDRQRAHQNVDKDHGREEDAVARSQGAQKGIMSEKTISETLIKGQI